MTAHGRSEADRNRDPEAGFTLLEMVIAVVIMVMITGAISAAFITSLKASSATKNRVGESQDAQLISGFLTRDAQAAGGTDPSTGLQDPTLGVTLPTGAFGNGCDPVPGTPLIGFKWIDQGSGTAYEANYSYVATATGTYKPQQLLRTVCSGIPPATPSPATSVLANNVVTTATGSSSVPAASCDATCAPNTTSLPKTVTLALTLLNTTDNVTTPYPHTLTASLRPQTNAHPDTSGPLEAAPMLLLGDGGSCSTGASISAGGAAGVQILGQGTVSSGCDTTDAHGCGNGCGDEAYPGMFVYSPTNDPAACDQVDGTCTVVGHKFADPYAGAIQAGLLHVPSTAGCNNGANPSPSGGNFGGSTTFPQLFNLNSVTTFSPGVYVFCKGITVRQNMTAGPDGSGNGSLFYVASGGVAVSGGTLSVTPPNTGEYAGLALWQAKGDTTTLTGGTIDIEGAAYLPSARVTFKNGFDYIEQLVCAGIDLQSGNNTTQIGPTLNITSAAALPDATQGQPYSTTITATGGAAPPYHWSASGLPGTMHIDANTGVISGTPTANSNGGAITVNITAKGYFGTDHDADTQAATLRIISAPTVASTSPSSRSQGATNQDIVVTGTNFVPGTQSGSFGAGITVNSVTYTNTTHVTANITIAANATIGSRDVTITTGDGGVSTGGTGKFSVTAAPSITSVQLVNKTGQTVGRIENGDKIIVTYSSQIDQSTMCAAWNSDTQDHSVNNANDIITLHDGGAAQDFLTFAAAPAQCASGFNFGQIDLSSTGYVTGNNNLTFTSSIYALTWSTNTMTITFGPKSGTGVIGTVASSTALYTASPLIRDSSNAPLPVLTFPVANGPQF